MKYYQLIITTMLFIYYGCNTVVENHKEKPVFLQKPVFEEKFDVLDSAKSQENTENKIPLLDLHAIKNCGTKGITSFHMDKVYDTEKYIDKSIVNNILSRIPFNSYKGENQNISKNKSVSCLQWEETDEYFMFTILTMESCCYVMYLCVADTGGKMIVIQELGRIGFEAGLYRVNRGEKKGFGYFTIYNEFTNSNTSNYDRNTDHIISEYTEYNLMFINNHFRIDTLYHDNKSDQILNHNKRQFSANNNIGSFVRYDSLIHEIKFYHKFSSNEKKDLFTISLKGKNILTGYVTISITRYDGELIFIEENPATYLIGYHFDGDATQDEKEKYIIERMNEFFKEDNFSIPTIDKNDSYDEDYNGNIDEWNGLKNSKFSVGFDFLIGEENYRSIAWLESKNKLITYYSCC